MAAAQAMEVYMLDKLCCIFKLPSPEESVLSDFSIPTTTSLLDLLQMSDTTASSCLNKDKPKYPIAKKISPAYI